MKSRDSPNFQNFFEFTFVEIWPGMAQDNIYLIIRHDPGCFCNHGTFIHPIMGDSMLVPQHYVTIYSMWLCGGVEKSKFTRSLFVKT